MLYRKWCKKGECGRKVVFSGNGNADFSQWITNALWSDFVTAAVRTGGPDSGAAGLSALIIPLTARGVTRRRLYNSGVSASGSTYIEFDEVEVPVENLIGGPAGVGQGFRMVMTSMCFYECLCGLKKGIE